MAPSYTIDDRLAPPMTVVLRGEIDLTRRAEMRSMRDAFWLSGHKDVDVDVTEVSFMDSTGAGALIAMGRLAQLRGGAVVVEGPRSQVRRLFDVLGVTEQLGVTRLPDLGGR